jgi:AAA15 family ATPase/GTPase
MAGYIEHIIGLIPHTKKSVDIPLYGKNLIITGGNGSGKTSFLRIVYDKTVSLILKKYQTDLSQLRKNLQEYEEALAVSSEYEIEHYQYRESINETQEKIQRIEYKFHTVIPNDKQFSSKWDNRQAVILYFDDRRFAEFYVAKTARGLQGEIEENRMATHKEKVGKKLEQHLLNMKNRRSLAITEDKDQELADNIGIWFTEFEKRLKLLFEDDSIQLLFNTSDNKVLLQQNDKPPFTFQTLSAGYNAIFDVYADLLMRTEYFSISPLELEGVVFIDEIDSHLHISLQRLILPFFTESFPKVQFIVTTHSPFVLMSTRDTLVYDLGKETPYSISQLKSHNEILSDYLGVPTAMPIWAEQGLAGILNKYLCREPDNISLSELKEDLINAGLEEYFPDSAAKILETK